MLERTRDQHRALWRVSGHQLARSMAGGPWAHGVSWDLPARPQHTCGVCSVGAVVCSHPPLLLCLAETQSADARKAIHLPRGHQKKRAECTMS